MYAIVRDTTYDAAELAQRAERINEFQALHASQPGYAGTAVIELSAGRWLTVNFWDTPEDATAALPVMGPAVQRLLEPMMIGPSQVIGAGPVILTDVKNN